MRGGSSNEGVDEEVKACSEYLRYDQKGIDSD